MAKLSELFRFDRTHDDIALDAIRIFLGGALFVRGVLFIADSSRIINLVRAGEAEWLLSAYGMQAVIIVHIIGGLALMVGLLTRLAALIQLPVLAGAVVSASTKGGLLMPDQSLELSVLVFVLLCVFAYFGSGPWSLNYVLLVRGRTPEAEAKIVESHARLRAKMDAWEAERQTRIAAEKKALAEGAMRPSEVQWFGLGSVGKYFVASIFAGAVFFVFIQFLPESISLAEIATIGGVLFLAIGAFYLFYGAAFEDKA